jgi:hypothetical protein
VFVGATFTVAKDGPVTINLEGFGKPEVWIDGRAAKDMGATSSNSSLTARLPAGTHSIILRLDGAKLPEKIRVSSGDVSWAVN